MARQKPSSPPSVERATTAASGSSAIRLRDATDMPRPRLARRRGGASRAARGAGRVASLAASALPLRLEDLRDRPLVGIEELVVDLAPAAELPDLEQLLRARVLVCVHELRVYRAVALDGEDPLGRVA